MKGIESVNPAIMPLFLYDKIVRENVLEARQKIKDNPNDARVAAWAKLAADSLRLMLNFKEREWDSLFGDDKDETMQQVRIGIRYWRGVEEKANRNNPPPAKEPPSTKPVISDLASRASSDRVLADLPTSPSKPKPSPKRQREQRKQDISDARAKMREVRHRLHPEIKKRETQDEAIEALREIEEIARPLPPKPKPEPKPEPKTELQLLDEEYRRQCELRTRRRREARGEPEYIPDPRDERPDAATQFYQHHRIQNTCDYWPGGDCSATQAERLEEYGYDYLPGSDRHGEMYLGEDRAYNTSEGRRRYKNNRDFLLL